MSTIKEENLISAAGYALIEAKKWGSIGNMVTKKGYEKERACIQVLAIEIYLKSILMSEGINISKIRNKKENGHNDHYLYDLYNRISENTKLKIKEGIDFSPIHEINPLNNKIKYDFYTFEEALKEISNNFVDLRYEYEKFVNGQSLYIMCNFINKLEKVIKEIAISEYTNIL